MATLVLSSMPRHWLLFLLLLFSGMAYVTDSWPAGFETGSISCLTSVSCLLSHLPFAICFLSVSL